ncbi:MAG: hypothetical protein IJH34_15645 [Romboutsia sp.]|nr:hypothetical protein [Romboutsia sp.]
MKKRKILEYLKNKKGAVEVIHSAVLMICVITIFVFFIDILFFTRSYIAMSNYVDGIARTISIHGGLQTSPPTNFPGGSSLYFTSSKIKSNTEAMCKKYNINDKEINMYIKRKKYSATTNPSTKYVYVINYDNQLKPSETSAQKVSSLKIDYGETITVSLQYKFKWTLTGLKANITINRDAISDFKHIDSDNTWEEM